MIVLNKLYRLPAWIESKKYFVLNRSSWLFFDKSFIVKQILRIVFISHENWLNKQHQTNKRFVVCIGMKSHWVKWVRLFYALFYIYRIRCIYISRWLSPKKKTRKQTKFNIDQEQVAPSTHQHTHSCLF